MASTMLAAGFDFGRAAMLLAVLEKRGGLKVSVCDAYLNIIGGLNLDEPAADLADCLLPQRRADGLNDVGGLQDLEAVQGRQGLGAAAGDGAGLEAQAAHLAEALLQVVDGPKKKLFAAKRCFAFGEAMYKCLCCRWYTLPVPPEEAAAFIAPR